MCPGVEVNELLVVRRRLFEVEWKPRSAAVLICVLVLLMVAPVQSASALKPELIVQTGHSASVQAATFSPDGKTLLTVSEDKTIKLWETASGRELRSISNWVQSVALSPDGKTFASASSDTTIKLWETDSAQGIASLCSFGKKDWVVVTKDGQYDASNLESISSLVWVLPDEPMKAYPLEIFMKQYFEPGLLGRILKREKLPDAPPLSELNRTQPLVTINSVTPRKDSTDLVDVTVSYQSVASEQPGKKNGKVSGVYELKLFRDGRLVAYLPEGESFYPKSRVDLSRGSDEKNSHTFTVKLPHNGAKNYSFSAFAFNVDQVKSSTTPSWIYQMEKPLETKKGRAYVIAFGVNQYEDPSWNLKHAIADAREYETTLIPRLKERELFSEVVPIRLVAPSDQGELPATKETLRDVLLALSGNAPANPQVAKILSKNAIRKIEPEDFVLLSFSCHGATNEKTGAFYLFPSNIGEKQDQGLTPELEKKGISSAELTDWVKDIDASDMVLVIDACHSGAAEGKEFKPGPMGSAGLGQLA